jgi:hypothetical protein
MRSWPRRRCLARLTVIVALVACSAGPDDASTTLAPTTTVPPTPSTTTTTLPPAGVDVQGGIDWFVTILNGDELTQEDYLERFGAEFREEVSYETMQSILDQFRPEAPFAVVDRGGGQSRGEAVIESATGTRSRVLAELSESGQFTTLLIQPTEAPTLDDPPSSVDEAFDRLSELGELRAMTAELVDGSCETIHSVSADEPAPLGSVFKLYVLAALGETVANGELSWDQAITVENDLKSIPPGELQTREPGTEVSILEATELMIAISDNTATDHLIDLLGRATIESVQGRYGNSTPELNTPFLDTRELAALKVGPASGLRTPQWMEGDEAERRAILDQLGDITPADIPIRDWVDPIDPDTVEWFASPEDLCDLALGLVGLTDSVPEVAQALEINPGVPAESGTWDRIWFKGGSEPGMLATWWLTQADGRLFLTAGSVVNAEETFDAERAVLLFAAVRDLLAP